MVGALPGHRGKVENMALGGWKVSGYAHGATRTLSFGCFSVK